MNKQLANKDNREFENESHIVRKKKANFTKQTTKNIEQIIELIDPEDDEFDISMYARYIK